MLSNLPIIDYLKKLSRKKRKHLPTDTTTTLYDIFNEGDQKHWLINILRTDKNRIERAQRLDKPVQISRNLSDVQLLKLHCEMFPDFDIKLVYHDDFDMYEVKNKSHSQYLFTYNKGKYNPISSIL